MASALRKRLGELTGLVECETRTPNRAFAPGVRGGSRLRSIDTSRRRLVINLALSDVCLGDGVATRAGHLLPGSKRAHGTGPSRAGDRRNEGVVHLHVGERRRTRVRDEELVVDAVASNGRTIGGEGASLVEADRKVLSDGERVIVHSRHSLAASPGRVRRGHVRDIAAVEVCLSEFVRCGVLHRLVWEECPRLCRVWPGARHWGGQAWQRVRELDIVERDTTVVRNVEGVVHGVANALVRANRVAALLVERNVSRIRHLTFGCGCISGSRATVRVGRAHGSGVSHVTAINISLRLRVSGCIGHALPRGKDARL